MAEAYYVETIERITEQMIEEEILSDVYDMEFGVRKFTAEQKRDMILSFGTMRNDIIKCGSDIDSIHEKTKKIVPDTITEIEDDIEDMIVQNGYVFGFVNDGNGNITTTLKVVE